MAIPHHLHKICITCQLDRHTLIAAKWVQDTIMVFLFLIVIGHVGCIPFVTSVQRQYQRFRPYTEILIALNGQWNVCHAIIGVGFISIAKRKWQSVLEVVSG
ncbi:MAG: hypothetical protein P4M14_11870 [Gammaproteobacteria bacterium]|nr:hypothetical protein [Gammaproteobacteria bacterium]